MKSNTIFIAISLLILFTDSLFVATNYFFSKEAVKEDLTKESESLHAAFDATLADTETNLLLVASVFAHDEQVQDLFHQGKLAVAEEGGGAGGEHANAIRRALYDLIEPRWKSAMQNLGARQLHFHLGPGSTSFLRVHRPDKFGDNMDDVRFTVVDTNAQQTPRSGFETGRVYSGIRGVVPVFWANPGTGEKEHIGALEAGVSFDKVINSFDRATNVGVTILLSKEHIESAMWPSYIETQFKKQFTACGCVVEASSRPFRDLIAEEAPRDNGGRIQKDNVVHILKDADRYYSASYFPLRDYRGHMHPELPDIGAIVLWKDVTDKIAVFNYNQLFNAIYGILTFLFVETLLYFGFKRATHHLEQQIAERTESLTESESRLKEAQQIAGMGHFVYNTKCHHFWSTELFRILGKDQRADAASIEALTRDIDEKQRAMVNQGLSSGLLTGTAFGADFRYQMPDGSTKCLKLSSHVEKDPLGKPSRVVGTIQDISHHKAVEERLESERRFLQSVIDGSADPIMVITSDYNVLLMNEPARANIPARWVGQEKLKCYQVSHHSEEPCNGSEHPCPLREVLEKQDRVSVTHKHPNSEGGESIFELIATPFRDKDGKICGIIEASRDITAHLDTLSELREQQLRIEHVAYHDALTGLPNRTLLNDRIDQAIRNAERTEGSFALLFIDLDNFKQINDSLGHQVGDNLLRAVSERLGNVVRREDTLARLGGDEFILLANSSNGGQNAGILAEKLLAEILDPFPIGNHQLYIGASIGICIYPMDGTNVEMLLRNADAAMYQAKENGRNTYHYYNRNLTDQALMRMQIDRDMHQAIANNQFELHYQPKFESASGKVCGVEALIRWKHPQRGYISPNEFIPIAEQSHLILTIGDWVLENICLQIAKWANAGTRIGQVAINVSRQQLQRPDFVERFKEIVGKHGCTYAQLDLEITETYIMRNPERAGATLSALRSLGVTISIDDFGTGYSSMSFLKSLPITKLKIDKSFISDIPDDANNVAITSAIIAMAKQLQLKLVGEGVETQEQYRFLRQSGCDEIQGYLFSKPLPPEELDQFLEHCRLCDDAT